MADGNKILDKVKNACNYSTDKDLAEFLGVTQNLISTWRVRNKVNFEVLIDKCVHLDFNLLFKEVPVSDNMTLVREESVEYSVAGENFSKLTEENKELKVRLEECRETLNRVYSFGRNITYLGTVAATPPEE